LSIEEAEEKSYARNSFTLDEEKKVKKMEEWERLRRSA
jgi:hypothetical protein